ncbi:hypothetical protein HK101_008907 [Irineochytrium annulatum]|nr:hypothetical protein HK101_008907 [Irineochytrium annulatum]
MSGPKATTNGGGEKCVAGIDALIENALAILQSLPDAPSDLIDTNGTINLPIADWPSMINSPIGATRVLVVNNASVYFVHDPVLKRGSALFSNMLDGRFKEGGAKVLRVEVPFRAQFWEVLSCLYLDEVPPLYPTDVPMTLANARYLAMDKLTKGCIRKLSTASLKSWSDLNKIPVDIQLAEELINCVWRLKKNQFDEAMEKLAVLAEFREGPSRNQFSEAVKRRVNKLIQILDKHKVERMSMTFAGKRILTMMGLEGFTKLTEDLQITPTALKEL